MKNTSWVSAMLSSVLLVGGMLPAFAQLNTPRAALVGEYAYILGDPRPIAAGRGYVQYSEWTRFGNAIAIVKFDVSLTADVATMVLTGKIVPAMTESAYLWNRKTNQTQLLERVNRPNQVLEYIEVLPNERTAVVTTRITNPDQSKTSQVRIVNGPLSEVIAAPVGGSVEYVASEEGSSVLVYMTDGKMASGSVSTVARIYDADRGRWTPVSLGLDSNQLIEYGGYSNRMDAFIIRVVGFGGGKEGFIAYFPANGNIVNLTAEQFKQQFRFNVTDMRAAMGPSLLEIGEQEVKYPDNTKYSIFTLGAVSGPSTPETRNRPGTDGTPARADKLLYFGAGADSVELSPKEDSVTVLRDGALSVQDVLRVDRSLMERKTGPETREEIMLRAKHVTMGLIMYASDNDEELPPADGLTERVMPYVKNEEMFDGFIYTYKGPLNMSLIKDPSNTELGFIRGIGGSAVAYADGTVRWKPDA